MTRGSKILVWHQGALGDILLSFPAIRAIRRSYEGALVHLVSRTDIGPVARQYGVADTVSSCEDGLFAGLFVDGQGLSARLGTFLSRFDAAFVFMRRNNEEFMRNIGKIIPDTALLRTFPPEGVRMHVSSFQLRQLDEMGLKTEDSLLPAGQEEGSLSSGEGRLIVIHPGSGGRKKCWPLERYLDLMRSLSDVRNRRFAVILGPAEDGLPHEDVASFALLCGIPVEVVRGRTVGEVSETIRTASVYIGNDSGITHLSALLGVPTVSIFGPTDPAIWRPLGRRVKVVRPAVSCSPCAQEMRNACHRPLCIESVRPEDVKKAAESLVCIA